MTFYAYLLRCADGSFYAGHTDDLERRMGQHREGSYPGYTSERRPVSLLWSEMFASRDDAKACERQIKGWSRAKKEALIAGDWDLISRLSRSRGRPGPSTGSGPTDILVETDSTVLESTPFSVGPEPVEGPGQSPSPNTERSGA